MAETILALTRTPQVSRVFLRPVFCLYSPAVLLWDRLRALARFWRCFVGGLDIVPDARRDSVTGIVCDIVKSELNSLVY